MSSYHGLLGHHGSGIRGSRVCSGLRGSGVRGSPVSIDAHILTKSAYLTKIRSLQLCLLWLVFEPRARGVACSR